MSKYNASHKPRMLLTKKKSSKYTANEVMKVFELLENVKIKAQEVANETNFFSARQIKKLRYIKKHMNNVEFSVLLEAKYYLSSIEKQIKNRVRVERKQLQNNNKKLLKISQKEQK